MPDRIITLQRFQNLTLAYMAKNKLELNGIEAFIADENVTVADPLYMNAVGGIRLTVFEKDKEKALILLAKNEEIETDEIEQEATGESEEIKAVKCPKCGSDNTRQEDVSPAAFVISFLVLGFPIPFLKRKHHCFSCQHEWK